MIKALLRNTGIYAFSLFLLPFLVSGVTINGGVQTLLIGGFTLTIMFLIIKPVFNILTFPFNFLTLGFFSTLTNAVILYLLTVFVPNVIIAAFRFPGASIAGFSIPAISFSTFFAFLLAAVVLSALSGGIRWITEK